MPQGKAYSPIGTELTLHAGLDRRLEAIGEINAFLQRYVDNIGLLSRFDSEGQRLLQLIRKLPAEPGLPSRARMDLRLTFENPKTAAV